MADPTFDQISASTLADLREDVVWDNFFVETSIQRTFRASGALDEFLGGTIMQEPFMYDRVVGGAIAPGSDVNIIQKQILAATAFTPREYVEQVPLNLFQTQVTNAGPAGKVKLVDLYMTNAVQSCSTDLEIDFWRHGQVSGGLVLDDRSIYINGASEACNDGYNPSWDANTFINYGGQVRNGAVGNVLNSIPVWAGTQAGGTGQISFKLLLEGYLNCVQPPDTGVCNKALFAYLLEREETKQRFAQETNPRIGMTGIRVMDAYIHVDKLAPSTKYGTILPSGLSLTTSIKPVAFTQTVPANANSGISNFNVGNSTTYNPGEVFFWFRIKGWKVRPSTDPEYNHNFTPPIRSQNNPDLVVMFYKVAMNMYTPQPRDNWQTFGIGF
jgi:hypothetical protein